MMERQGINIKMKDVDEELLKNNTVDFIPF